jgi:hypothetical protein
MSSMELAAGMELSLGQESVAHESFARKVEVVAPAGGPARVFAGIAFFYAVTVTVGLLLATNMFSGEQDRDTVLLWLLLPILASFGSWNAVRSAFAPLRGWVWFAVLASMFFVWIAVFSIGLFFVPVPLLLLVAVLIPWREEDAEAVT